MHEFQITARKEVRTPREFAFKFTFFHQEHRTGTYGERMPDHLTIHELIADLPIDETPG